MRRGLPRAQLDVVTPDINVTPLVDVVLVLLIIFMVVAPRMEQDIQVDLPGIFNPDPDVKLADPIKLTVAKAGEYHIGEQQFDIESLAAQLSAEHSADPNRRLVLRADAKLTYGDVRKVLERTQEIGFPGLSFLVGERHRTGPETNQHALAAAPEAAAPAPPGAVEAGSHEGN